MTTTQLIYTNPNEAYHLIVKTKEQADEVTAIVNKELSRLEVYTTKDSQRALVMALTTINQ